MLSEMTACDIIIEFNKALTSDPNHNYVILHNHIKNKEKKTIWYEKLHKHWHKKNKWITYGILRFIEFRDEMNLKYKICSQNSAEYIRNAKIHYSNVVFEENKKNIKDERLGILLPGLDR